MHSECEASAVVIDPVVDTGGAPARDQRINAPLLAEIVEKSVFVCPSTDYVAARACRAGENASQCIEGGRHDPVVRPFATLRPFEQTGINQNL